jgi:1-acyl-sn-glycerol-3-phosphate acyltransferase
VGGVNLRLAPTRLVRTLPFPYRAPAIPRGVEPPRRKATKGGGYETEWARRWPARATRLVLLESVVRPAARALADPQRRGLDRLATLEGPAIFVSNHHSHLDTPLMLCSIPEPWRHRMVVGAAADYFFGTRVTSALSALVIGAVPIERTRVNRRSADQAAALIDDGWSFLVFPEGGRSPDGWGQPFRGGAAYLSLRCGVPVVPVHLAGTGRVLGKGMTRPKPARTRVTFGHPLAPEEGERSEAFNQRIEAAVAALADESTTDWWQARRRAHAGATPALTGPDAPTWRRAWALGDTGARRRQKRRWPKV